MKFYVLVLVALTVFLPFKGLAQTRPGIKFGLNRSTISKTTLDSKNGIYLGGLLDIPLGKFYTLQPEVFYSAQGGSSNSPEYDDVNVHYLSLAASNKLYLTQTKALHFIAGLGFDINLKNNFISLSNGNGDGEISPVDPVVFGGVGYEFDFGLIVEARYKQGTASIDFFGRDDLYEEDGSQLNMVIQMGLAYKFKR